MAINTTALPEEEIILPRVRELLGDKVLESHCRCGDETIIVAPADIQSVMQTLKEDEELSFESLMDLFGVDNEPEKPRYEVIYHLCSTTKRLRLRVKVRVAAKDGTVPTLREIWPGADWYEREVYDMFGLTFDGHPDMRRLLLYTQFEGHPLRKDYPVTKRQPLVGPRN